MADFAEIRTTRVTDLSRRQAGGRSEAGASEPTVPDALEKIASASQHILAKRIDLFLLENQQLVAGLLVQASVLSFGVVTGLTAWFAALGAFTNHFFGASGLTIQLGFFALVNAIVGALVVSIALRETPRLTSEIEEAIEDREGAQSGN